MATESPSSPTPPHPPAVEDTHPDAATADLPSKTDLDATPPPEAAVVTEGEVAETQEEPKSEQAAPEVKEEEDDKEKVEEQKSSPAIAEAAEEDSKGKSELENTPAVDDKKTFINPAVSFKEESYFVSDLSESERRSLDEFKKLVQEAIDTNTLSPSPLPPPQQPSSTTKPEPSTTIESALKRDRDPAQAQQPAAEEEPTQVSIWGIPLLKDERTDVVVLKFLRARDFNVSNALSMLKSTLQWRAKFGIDRLLEEDLGDDLEKVVFTHGHDREGHPVCYNVYGEFQNKELYAKTFGDEEKRGRFLRWRIQFLERSIRKLDFRPGGVNTIFQVNDLKNAPGPGKKELRQATRQALQLLQDNYPEFVAKQVFINLPWWYVAFYTMMSPFMTQRTKSKFVFTGPAKTAETLFKYISPEQVPIQYGGLSVDFCDCNPEFTVDDPATEIHVKPTTKQFVEILVSEKCVILWELRVIGWDVTYSAEFVPKSNDKYTVIIQKATKMTSTDDPVVSGSFTISDLGKIVLTVDNPTFKRRKLVYRYKVLPYQES